VSAAAFLDSNMANTDMVSLLPDPDSASFNPSDLPADTTLHDLHLARQNYTRLFSPSAPNPENLDRSTLADLLPQSNHPLIRSVDERPFTIRVVAHDPATFAEESLKICTRGLTERYIEPAWHGYNKGLRTLHGPEGSGPELVVAKGSGHFIQRDNPRCVADVIWDLLGTISEE